MVHFRIHFSYPLLLLVFLLGLGLTALLYFRLSKKYRKNRNRVTSMVLHLVVFALAVLTLAGTLFTYEIPNKNNQIIILVDASDTEAQADTTRDEFVRAILNRGQYDGYSVGIVTFGYDQVYAVEMTDKVSVDRMMNRYLAAEKPDTTATDIAAALTYTSTLFTHPETARIVLVTDGKETDEAALDVIRGVSAKGIGVDVANVPSAYHGADMQLVGTVLPDYHVSPGATCPVSVTLYAGTAGAARVEFYDNGTLVETQSVSATAGTQNVTFNHTFAAAGLHSLSFRLFSESSGTTDAEVDVLTENNIYYTYLNIENFDKILILEHKDGESEALKALLTEGDDPFDVTVKNITTDNTVPRTMDEMRQYDQIVLNNVQAAEMPEGFQELLRDYVGKYGGGVFTVGGADVIPGVDGEDDKYVAHAYNREDMGRFGKVLQEIMPVQAVDYTPPTALIVIVDRSGSMGATDSNGNTYYELALAGARGCLDKLTERDYFGLMTLDSDYEIRLGLTPRSETAKINRAIVETLDLGPTGGTVFPGPIETASRALLAMDVAVRHVIIVTDGLVPEDQEKEYLDYISQFHNNNGITYSVVGIGVEEGSDAAIQMETACKRGGGKLYTSAKGTGVTDSMQEDLHAAKVDEVNYRDKDGNPIKYDVIANDMFSPLLNGIELATTDTGRKTPKLKVTIDGFFGVKVKDDADLVLVSNYGVPLYAQWQYGKGTVGSFMCDLNGTWSSDFLSVTEQNEGSGRQFIRNAVTAVMPLESVRESQITIQLNRDNYTNQLSIFSSLGDGERIIGYLKNMADAAGQSLPLDTVTAVPEGMRQTSLGAYITSALDATNHYSRCGFVIKDAGVYEIALQKVDAAGSVLAEYKTYCAFSYSEEHDIAGAPTDAEAADLLAKLAADGKGVVVEESDNSREFFTHFVTAVQKTFDPRYVFMIIALVLFLADVAVRKFKFKWPHELVREHKEKANRKKGGSEQ